LVTVKIVGLLRSLAGMARLMGVAFCLLLPSLVATAGIESWGDDSALLQVEPAMASLQTESFNTNVEALRSLLAVAQSAARKHNDSLADSTEFYMSTVQPQMENASNFIVDKLATLSATRSSKKKSTVCKLCIVSAVIDGLTLVYEAGTSGGLAQKCSPVVVILWWVMGLLTMTIEQKLPFVDALDMLAQQFTSVGYGSSSQDTDGIKIFHGLHGIVSQMSVNRVMTEFFASALNSLEKLFADKIGRSPDVLSATVSLLGIGALITFIFALDLGEGKKTETFGWFLSGTDHHDYHWLWGYVSNNGLGESDQPLDFADDSTSFRPLECCGWPRFCGGER